MEPYGQGLAYSHVALFRLSRSPFLNRDRHDIAFASILVLKEIQFIDTDCSILLQRYFFGLVLLIKYPLENETLLKHMPVPPM